MSAPVVPDAAHGTVSGYSWFKCRCHDCAARWTQYQTRYGKEYRRGRRRMIPAVEASTKIQILEQLGWAQYQIAAACDLSQSQVNRLARGRTVNLRWQVHQKIMAGYTHLTGRQNTLGGRAGRMRPDEEPETTDKFSDDEVRNIITSALDQGHKLQEISDITGMHTKTLKGILAGRTAGPRAREAVRSLRNMILLEAADA